MQENEELLFAELTNAGAIGWADEIRKHLKHFFTNNKHGSSANWRLLVDKLPDQKPSFISLSSDTVAIGLEEDLQHITQEELRVQLMKLHPWRKGPYNLYGLEVDTEWRSDWKWRRLNQHISSLKNRLVLDVGCGNGYHCWRMLGEGARFIIGIDPLLLNNYQFQYIYKLHGQAPICLLPYGLEQLPKNLKIFDTVFSMGVLYHRKSPIDHLLELKDCLRVGGELILETLVVDGVTGYTLMPEDRYAKMRNVWFIPSCGTLSSWLKRCGYKNIELIDVSITTVEEQRSTDWMQFNSLPSFLDSNKRSLTCEGYPAPKRAIFKATC